MPNPRHPEDEDDIPQGGLGISLGLAIGRRWTPIAAAGGASTAGQAIGLLLALTKAS